MITPRFQQCASHFGSQLLLQSVKNAFNVAVEGSESLIANFDNAGRSVPGFNPEAIPARRRFIARRVKLLQNLVVWRKYTGERFGLDAVIGRLAERCILSVAEGGWDVGGKEMVGKVRLYFPALHLMADDICRLSRFCQKTLFLRASDNFNKPAECNLFFTYPNVLVCYFLTRKIALSSRLVPQSSSAAFLPVSTGDRLAAYISRLCSVAHLDTSIAKHHGLAVARISLATSLCDGSFCCPTSFLLQVTLCGRANSLRRLAHVVVSFSNANYAEVAPYDHRDIGEWFEKLSATG